MLDGGRGRARWCWVSPARSRGRRPRYGWVSARAAPSFRRGDGAPGRVPSATDPASARRGRDDRGVDGTVPDAPSLPTDRPRRGATPHTPAGAIQSVTPPDQRVRSPTLATIAAAAERDGLEAPVVTVIGEVASMGEAGITPIAAVEPVALAAGAERSPIPTSPEAWSPGPAPPQSAPACRRRCRAPDGAGHRAARRQRDHADAGAHGRGLDAGDPLSTSTAVARIATPARGARHEIVQVVLRLAPPECREPSSRAWGNATGTCRHHHDRLDGPDRPGATPNSGAMPSAAAARPPPLVPVERDQDRPAAPPAAGPAGWDEQHRDLEGPHQAIARRSEPGPRDRPDRGSSSPPGPRLARACSRRVLEPEGPRGSRWRAASRPPP